MYPDTQFLRAIGIILILNSHLDRYYPIAYIGTGGAIGNSIFFFLSSFGVCLSFKKSPKPFSEWYAGRIRRIYPSLWIVLLAIKMPLMIMEGKLSSTTVLIFLGYFFNPPYWFLQVLLVYSLLSFRFLKANPHKILIIVFILSLTYLGSYITWVDLSRWSIEEAPFDLIHYFIIFVFGIYIADKNKQIVYSGISNYILLLFFVCLIYFHKFLMTKGLYIEYQIIQQVAIYPTLLYFLKISRSPFVVDKIMKTKCISSIFQFLADNTLEIYMIHETISSPILKLGMPFPVNLMLFLLLTFAISAIVNKLANSIRKNVQ